MGAAVTPRPRCRLLLVIVVAVVFAESAICNTRQQASGSGDLPIEAAVNRVMGEEVLRALLAAAASNVEVGVKQQRVTRRDRVGNHAERIKAMAMLRGHAQELLPDSCGL